MNWDEWTGYLEELVGHGSGGQSVHLLAPKSGNNDLTQQEANDLADAIHHKLFISNSPSITLDYIYTRPTRESLPLLYLSAWLARQQENRLAFWQPFFNDAVIRGKLSPQTVQQSLAPRITDLWWKMHQEWRIYRPQEGRVHVKWPQAHAGLTESEVELLLSLLARMVGWSEEPPDTLQVEPEEFLGLLRVWLQFESYGHRQLQRLIYGPDGPALVVAELAQRIMAERWPPSQKVYDKAQGPHTSSPYLMLDYDPLTLQVILPEGNVPGYALVYARYADDKVQLDTSYSEQMQRTRYDLYKWPVNQLPWPQEVTLTYLDRKIDLGVRPECPFGKQQGATLMLEASTGRYVRRWHPHTQYLLLLKQDEYPEWISELFVDEEIVDVGRLSDQDFQVVSAVGRDIADTLDRAEASSLLRRLEVELARTGALISLPDLDDLYRTTVSLRGGMLVNDDPNLTYLVSTPPAVFIQNLRQSGTALSGLRRHNDGSESLIASASLSPDVFEHIALLRLPVLDEGSYVIRGIGKPLYFNLVTDPVLRASMSMTIELRLLCAEGVAAGDDIRHFKEEGLEISAWPFAPATLTIQTEAGTSSYPLRLNADGKRVVRAYEIDLPTTTRWAILQATCWLARSRTLNLALKPYIAESDWTLDKGRFSAKITGADPGTVCRLTFLPSKPWTSRICESQITVEDDFYMRCQVKTSASSGWMIITELVSNLVCLLGKVGSHIEEYSYTDFNNVYGHDLTLQDHIVEAGRLNIKLQSMISLVHVAQLTKKAMIPLLTTPMPDTLASLSTALDLIKTILVQLPVNWGGHTAKIILSDDIPRVGLLQIDGRQLKVQIVSVGTKRWVLWDEPSAPRVCGACRKLMTERQSYAHNCGGVGDKYFIAPGGRSFGLNPHMNWPAIMEAIKHLLLDTLLRGYEVPEGLESVWDSLQKSHREQIENPVTDPVDWIQGSIAGWLLLFDVLNNPHTAFNWQSISDHVKPFEKGIVALARIFV